jgi:putative redox protein
MAVSIVQLKNVDGFTSLISARTHSVVVDRVTERGGNDLGFTGGELLLAAQGGCFATTFFGAAQARGIAVSRFNVTVTGVSEPNPSRYVSIHLAVDVEADASDEEIDKLILIAERGCTVSNTLRPGVELGVSRSNALVAAG